MNKKQAILNYENYQKINNMYTYAVASISYDDSTGAPKKAFKERNDVLNYFQMLLFERSISNEYQQIINDLSKCYNSLSMKYKRIVDLMSHGNYSIFEPKEMVNENKEYFKKVLNTFLENYSFNEKLFEETQLEDQ